MEQFQNQLGKDQCFFPEASEKSFLICHSDPDLLEEESLR
jgi:hypothetical protein